MSRTRRWNSVPQHRRVSASVARASKPDLAALEKDLIAQALEHTGGNRSRAARLLGLTRRHPALSPEEVFARLNRRPMVMAASHDRFSPAISRGAKERCEHAYRNTGTVRPTTTNSPCSMVPLSVPRWPAAMTADCRPDHKSRSARRCSGSASTPIRAYGGRGPRNTPMTRLR